MQPEELKDKVEATALVASGTAAGAGVSAVVGGMGLVGGFGGVVIGAAPVMAAGAVVGSAAYGAKKAIEEGDVTAIGAVAGGAAAGAGISAVVGGMGLAVGGTAVAIGAAPVVAAGAVVGLAAYGLNKLLGNTPSAQTACSVEKTDIGQAIAARLDANLKAAKQEKLREDQAARDQFWSCRDARTVKCKGFKIEELD